MLNNQPKLVIQTPRGRRITGPGYPSFIVAEMSGNHNQDFKRALKIIDAAAEAGADAIKLQTYTPDTITIDSEQKYFRVKTANSWNDKTLYQLYQTAYTPWDWQPKLNEYAQTKGLTFFSTPFDVTAVDFLEKMKVPLYKIAGYEFVHVPLLKKVAATGKPIIVSIGYPSLEEIKLCLSTLRGNGAGAIALLHCVTTYQLNPRIDDLKLGMISDIATRFKVITGFSDNNASIDGPVLAVACGGAIIEKHLTLKRADGGPDADFSIEPAEFKEMVSRIRRLEKSLVNTNYAKTATGFYKQFHPTIFAVKDIKRGEKFTPQNIRVIRPGQGLAARYFAKIINQKAAKALKRGTPLKWNLIK